MKRFECFTFQKIHSLRVVGGAQRGRNQCLSFTRVKIAVRVLSAHTRFDPDIADLIEAALVGTDALVENLNRGKFVLSGHRKRPLTNPAAQRPASG
jgi:hypothetical protein